MSPRSGIFLLFYGFCPHIRKADGGSRESMEVNNLKLSRRFSRGDLCLFSFFSFRGSCRAQTGSLLFASRRVSQRECGCHQARAFLGAGDNGRPSREKKASDAGSRFSSLFIELGAARRPWGDPHIGPFAAAAAFRFGDRAQWVVVMARRLCALRKCAIHAQSYYTSGGLHRPSARQDWAQCRRRRNGTIESAQLVSG